MEWELIRQWGTLILAAVLAGERAVQWILRKEFATANDFTAVQKAFSAEQTEQDRRITAAVHRVELLEKQLEQMPGYSQLDEIKAVVGELKEAQAGHRAKLEAMKESLDQLRASIDRMSAVVSKNH